MRILHLPDLHCSPATYNRTEADGTPSRLREWQTCAAQVVDIARAVLPDLIVAPGDFFAHARPSATQILAVAQLFRELDVLGIAPVVGCAGNHDLTGPGQPGPVALVGAMGPHPDWWGSERPWVVTVPHACVAVLPAVKPAGLLEQSADPAAVAQLVSSKLVEIARGLRAQCKERYNLLIGHWTIAGSVTSSGQVMVGGTEPAIPLAELQAQGWDAVLFGHIHKPQVLSDKPYIGYAGALLRGDFGEEHEERGVYLIDLAAGTHECIPVAARRFCTLDAAITGPQGFEAFRQSLEAVDAEGCPDYRDAVVRVRYRCTEEVAKHADHAAIIRTLEAHGAYLVAGVYPEIERSERARAAISESTGPLEALAQWLDLRADVSGGLRERVTAAAGQILREVT